MPRSLTPTQVRLYCAQRLPSVLPEATVQILTEGLVALCDANIPLPLREGRILYSDLSLRCGLAINALRPAHRALVPLLAAMARQRMKPAPNRAQRPVRPSKSTRVRPPKDDVPPLPPRFDQALSRLMADHGDNAWRVSSALREQGLPLHRKTLSDWAEGTTRPKGQRYWPHLRAVAVRYGYPADVLVERLSSQSLLETDSLGAVPRHLRGELAWHLPDDFSLRPAAEQAEILEWVHSTIGSGGTAYRRYVTERRETPYALRPDGGSLEMPASLQAEIEALIAFKTDAFVQIGFQRSGVWNAETAQQKRTQLGQMFGALKAIGMKPHALTLGLLVLPKVWDEWLRWREETRGFYVTGEADALRFARSLVRPGTGWLRQSPHLAYRLRVVKGLISRDDIAEIRADWTTACDRFLTFTRGRTADIQRVARIHRDPFEPVLSVLEAPSPVGEYRKICDEIERRIPDRKVYPIEAAEAVRALLMLRLGLHLGLRQRNLREMRLCAKGKPPTSERKL